MGVDVDIIFGSLWVRHEWLDQELSQNTDNSLHLLRLASSRSNPGLRLWPCLVQGKETALASSLDELIGLRNELRTGSEEPWICDLGLVENGRNLSILREVERGELWRRVVC